jgi:hypothetical protein
MKRITVWVDCKNEDLEETLKRVKKALESVGEWYTIVCVDHVEWPERSLYQK